MFCYNIKFLEKMHIQMVIFLYELYFQCLGSQTSKIIRFYCNEKTARIGTLELLFVHQDLISSR